MELELLNIKMKESQKQLEALEMYSSPKANLSLKRKKEQSHKDEIMRVHPDLDNTGIPP